MPNQPPFPITERFRDDCELLVDALLGVVVGTITLLVWISSGLPHGGGMSLTHRGYLCSISMYALDSSSHFGYQSAYDTIWRARLLQKLVEVCVRGYFVWWTQSFLMERIAMLEVGEHMREVLISCGIS